MFVLVKLLSCVQLFCNPMGPPGSSVHGISQARILEWVAISFSRGSSRPRDQSPVPQIVAMRETARVQLQQPGIQPEEMDGVGEWDSLSVFYGLPVYSKFKILSYTFTKTLGQRFDIFSCPSLRFIISINHCCSSNRVPASVILWESALSSIIYLF